MNEGGGQASELPVRHSSGEHLSVRLIAKLPATLVAFKCAGHGRITSGGADSRGARKLELGRDYL